MRVPQQFTLAIEHPHEQRLDNFVQGGNGELLQTLTTESQAFSGYWIFGATGSGRSHLLRGCCLQAQDQKVPSSYIGCADYASDWQGLGAALTHAGMHSQVVAVDDVDSIAGQAQLEELLMAIYQRLLQVDGRLLVTHSQAAQALKFVTPDLTSRARSLQHFQLQPLSDSGKVQLLRQRAQNRGYVLSEAVLDYWLARGPRDLGALLTDLDGLDRASLAQQRHVTIPLLKRVLGY